VDWQAFDRECTGHLASYARPAFVRITLTMALTSTFKHQKGELVKEGFALDKVKQDRVYYYSQREHRVVPLTPELVAQINAGTLQL
jgi:hypothetical protein